MKDLLATKIAASVLLLTTLLAGTSGCTSLGMSAGGAARLSRMSPLEANPADIVLALRGPDFFKVRDGDIKLTVTFDGGTSDTRFVEEYAAEIIRDPVRANGIDQTDFGSDQLALARLGANDVAKLRATQSRVLKLRAAGIRGKGQMSISAAGCFVRDPGEEEFLITAWIQTQPTDTFEVLMNKFDVRKLFKQDPKVKAEFKLCDDRATASVQ